MRVSLSLAAVCERETCEIRAFNCFEGDRDDEEENATVMKEWFAFRVA